MISHSDLIDISGALGVDREPVTFCDADACGACSLSEGEPDCLRRKADFCLWLAARFSGTAVSAALQKLGLDLIKDSEALQQQRAIISRRNHAAT